MQKLRTWTVVNSQCREPAVAPETAGTNETAYNGLQTGLTYEVLVFVSALFILMR